MHILLITYFFPPMTGPRCIRWSNFVTHLAQRGYRIDVLTIKPSAGAEMHTDEGFFASGNVRVFRTDAGPFHKALYRVLPVKGSGQPGSKQGRMQLRSVLRGAFKKILEPVIIPDKMAEWIPSARGALRQLLKQDYDMVISSSAPITDHLLGHFVKRKKDIPWIADYGDPWGALPAYKPWQKRVFRSIESRFLRGADRIIVTTEETKQAFIQTYPFLTREQINVIPQGYDPALYERIAAHKAKRFRIVYTGIFYEGYRDPYIFFETLLELRDIDFEFLVAGDANVKYRNWIKNHGLEDKVKFLGFLNHEEAIAYQKGADVLLLIGWESGLQIPAKTFEYLGACRPILTIEYNEKSISGRLVKDMSRGLVVLYEREAIARALRQLYTSYSQGLLEHQFNLKPVPEHSWHTRNIMIEELVKQVLSER